MNYYREKLSATRLEACYNSAPPRIKQYLKAEIQHLISRLSSSDKVLELGCGYGRLMFAIAPYVRYVVGIDNSEESLEYAKELQNPRDNCEFLLMDALNLGFSGNEFDAVICNQNGICAINGDTLRLVQEALRVTKTRGRVIFSSYSDKFWAHRLDWFLVQAKQGLIGEIDMDETHDGRIVCKDGLRLDSMDQKGFINICEKLNVNCQITEVDESSIFSEMIKI